MKATYSIWTWTSEIVIAHFGVNKVGTYLPIEKTVSEKAILRVKSTFILSLTHLFISKGSFSVLTSVLGSGIIHSSFKSQFIQHLCWDLGIQNE